MTLFIFYWALVTLYFLPVAKEWFEENEGSTQGFKIAVIATGNAIMALAPFCIHKIVEEF